MTFDKLNQASQVSHTRNEFTNLIKYYFDHPHTVKDLVKEKKISVDEGRAILKTIHSLNRNPCACCRVFDIKKLNLSPIDDSLIPMLDMAQESVKKLSF
jgi:hypothetical protein